MQHAALEIVHRPPADLRPNPRNPRTHSKKQIRQIADSILTFGFTNPVLLDDADRIIAGHGRVAAAKLLGIATVPTIRLGQLSEVERRAYAIADNRLAELAGWDKQLLALELRYIGELEIAFELTLTGFETAEIDLLLETDAAAEAPSERLPEVRGPAVTRPGDLWLLGPHRLLCGDATDAVAYGRLMAGKRAQLVFADPPYNVPVDGHICGLGRTRHPEFPMAAGEMSPAEFATFLRTVAGNLVDHSLDGALHYICMDWRHLPELLEAGRHAYAELKNLCVWDKGTGGMGSLYRSQHELVLVFKNGTASHLNNVELGRHGRNRTNVWRYPGANALRAGGLEELRLHPTVKPVGLVVDLLLDASRRRGVVLDPFLGSGTTLIAAERTGRRAYAMELEGHYVDVAIRRWQEHTGGQAILAGSASHFAAVAEDRDPAIAAARRTREATADGE
jgi:hypothetical protein